MKKPNYESSSQTTDFVFEKDIPMSTANEAVLKMCPSLTKEQTVLTSSFIHQNNPYMISIIREPHQFCEIFALRGENEDGEVLFGQAQFAKSLFRNCYVGILENPQEPAAITISCEELCSLYIYIPEEKG